MKWPPVAGRPRPNAARTMKTSPPYFASTVTLLTIAASETPRMLKKAVRAIANAANHRTVQRFAGFCGSIPTTRKKYSENTIEIAPSEAARIMENCPHPKRKPASRPQPSRQKTYMPPV